MTLRHKANSMVRRPWRAFTLIELLVVIAIISLLAAILAPALDHLKTYTKEVICATDTRALVEATLMYGTDNRGWTPDLSLNPDTGAVLGAAPYWTWPQWRRHFEDRYDISHRQWYSLSNPKWGLDRFYYYGWNGSNPDTASHMVMGRFYFGSKTKMNSAAIRNALPGGPYDPGISLFPTHIWRDSTFKMLWTDLNRQWPAGPMDYWVTPNDPDRWGANHLYYLGDPALGYWPEGSHVGNIDGSVTWTNGADIEYRITINGAEMYW